MCSVSAAEALGRGYAAAGCLREDVPGRRPASWSTRAHDKFAVAARATVNPSSPSGRTTARVYEALKEVSIHQGRRKSIRSVHALARGVCIAWRLSQAAGRSREIKTYLNVTAGTMETCTAAEFAKISARSHHDDLVIG